MSIVSEAIEQVQKVLFELQERKEAFESLEGVMDERIGALGSARLEYSCGVNYSRDGIYMTCYLEVPEFLRLIRPQRQLGVKLCSFAVSATELGSYETYTVVMPDSENKFEGSLLIKCKMNDAIRNALRAVGAITQVIDKTTYETVQCPDGETSDSSIGMEESL